MSMTLNLEAAEGLKLEEVAQALGLVAGSEVTNKGSSLEAYFPNSNVSVSVKNDLSDTSVLTEELEGVDWKVGVRIYFDIDSSRSNAMDDVKEFVHAFSRLTSVPFALSFEYETLYAKRDESGLVLSSEF
ncbi:hypothetical protein ACJO5Y_00355 [Marinobacter sp. GN3S48]|uniref:hypothetical protein n=1 Tax=Marinobacter sp. GN3S48 TaxID=3382302 RepID=UPI00387ADF44